MRTDEGLRGLAAPRRTFELGRHDVPPTARPGAMLLEVVAGAYRRGDFDRTSEPAPTPYSTRRHRHGPTAGRPSGAYAAFDDEPGTGMGM